MVLSEWTIPRFLFCKHHVSNLFVLQTPPIAPPIAQSPLPPSHFWWVFNRSFFFSHDFVHKFVHHEEFGGDCFFYCRCVITVPYVFGLHGTVVSLHAVYSTVCTMVGVSLPYCLHVLLQYTQHGTVVSVHPVYSAQVLFVLPSRWCVKLKHHFHVLQYTPHGTIILVPQTLDYLYRIMCIYTLYAAATVVSVRLLYSTIPFVPCWYNDSTLTSLQTSWCHIHFANSTLITTSFLKLPFPPFPLSFFPHYICLAPSHSWWVCALLSYCSCWLLLCCLWFHHDEFGACFFLTVGASLLYCLHVQYGLHDAAVFMHPLYSTVCTMLVRQFGVVQFASIVVSQLFVLQTPHSWPLPSSSFLAFLPFPLSFSSTTVLLPLVPCEFEHCCLVLLVDCCLVICDFTMMNLVIAFFLLLVRQYRIVCMYCTGCMVPQLPCTRCTVLFVPCWRNNSTFSRLHRLLCHIHLFCKVHAHWPLGIDICFSFWLWITLLPCFLFFSLALYEECNYPHSALLSAVRNKSPSPPWLYASIESARCLE